MRRLYHKSFHFTYRGWILSVLLFCAMLGLFWYGFGVISNANRDEGREVLLSSLQRAAVNCYAVEGVYPPNVKYLEDHYGVLVNHDQYIVQYELAGSNIMPSISVFEKGADSEGAHE